MKSHEINFKNRTIRYYDAYDADHLGAFIRCVQAGNLCVLLGPTGIGKTAFYDFACASCLNCENHNLLAYQRRYGCKDPAASADRVISMAQTLRRDERLTVAFYPKTDDLAARVGGDTWRETRTAIAALVDGLSAEGLRERLVGLEVSVEIECGVMHDDIRQFVSDHSWCLIEFRAWNASMKKGFRTFSFMRNKDRADQAHGTRR